MDEVEEARLKATPVLHLSPIQTGHLHRLIPHTSLCEQESWSWGEKDCNQGAKSNIAPSYRQDSLLQPSRLGFLPLFDVNAGHSVGIRPSKAMCQAPSNRQRPLQQDSRVHRFDVCR